MSMNLSAHAPDNDESAQPRKRSIVTRPFSSTEGRDISTFLSTSTDPIDLFKKHQLAPSSVKKEEALCLNSFILKCDFAERRDFLQYLKTVNENKRTEGTKKVVSDSITFICKKVFNIGDKEASSLAVLVPFLTGAVDQLCKLTDICYVLDPSFCVYNNRCNGANPATDLAIVSFM